VSPAPLVEAIAPSSERLLGSRSRSSSGVDSELATGRGQAAGDLSLQRRICAP